MKKIISVFVIVLGILIPSLVSMDKAAAYGVPQPCGSYGHWYAYGTAGQGTFQDWPYVQWRRLHYEIWWDKVPEQGCKERMNVYCLNCGPAPILVLGIQAAYQEITMWPYQTYWHQQHNWTSQGTWVSQEQLYIDVDRNGVPVADPGWADYVMYNCPLGSNNYSGTWLHSKWSNPWNPLRVAWHGQVHCGGPAFMEATTAEIAGTGSQAGLESAHYIFA